MQLLLSSLLICGAISIGWLKGNLKLLVGLDWEPWKYWAVFSLPQTYLGLYGWWGLLIYTSNDTWKSMVISSSLAFSMQILLNSYFWGVNPRATLGLLFIIVGGLLAR